MSQLMSIVYKLSAHYKAIVNYIMFEKMMCSNATMSYKRFNVYITVAISTNCPFS